MTLKPFLSFVLSFWIILMGYSPLFAQKNKKELLQNISSPASAIIDGKLSEWPEDLFLENKASSLNYLLANDDSTLFIMIKNTNPLAIRKILTGGISISFNATGQKKALQTVTFPVLERRGRNQTTSPQNQKNTEPSLKLKEDLAGIRDIRVNGFDGILDGKIAIQNEYGIKAECSIDADGLLVCEYALPIKLLQIDASKSDIFACQIRINGLNLSSLSEFQNPNLRNGVPGGLLQQRKPNTDLLQGTEFWILTRLSN